MTADAWPSSVDLIARARGRAVEDRLKHELSRDRGEQSKLSPLYIGISLHTTDFAYLPNFLRVP